MTTTPSEPKRKRKLPWRVIVPAAAGVLGIAIGSASAGGTPPAAAPAETIVETREIEVAAPSCIEALDAADAGFDLASRMGYVMQDFLTAAAELDVAAMEAGNADLEQINTELVPVMGDYLAAKEECRAAG